MPIDRLRFLQRSNLQGEQDIQRGYYREIVHSYGIDVSYFRKDNTFFATPSGLCNYTYGEFSTATYFLSAPMVVFMQMHGDAFLLSKFGIETQANASIYFTIDDFTNQFRDLLGTPTSGTYSVDLIGNFNSFSGYMSGSFADASLSGTTISDQITFSSSGYVSGTYMDGVVGTCKPVNHRIKNIRRFDDGGPRFVLGTLNGTYEGNLDLSGNGTLSGSTSGLLGYWMPPAINSGPHWIVNPQVGDFFRLTDFAAEGGNNEEYEISQVYDRNLQVDGVNPLGAIYVWRCDVIRRDPSYEQVPVDPNHVEEQFTEDKSPESTAHEIVSDLIFEYTNNDIDSVDLKGADSVYGGYSR